MKGVYDALKNLFTSHAVYMIDICKITPWIVSFGWTNDSRRWEIFLETVDSTTAWNECWKESNTWAPLLVF